MHNPNRYHSLPHPRQELSSTPRGLKQLAPASSDGSAVLGHRTRGVPAGYAEMLGLGCVWGLGLGGVSYVDVSTSKTGIKRLYMAV